MSLSAAKIVVVDSNGLFRDGLISLLQRECAQPVGEASDIADLKRLAADGRDFDLVLLEACPWDLQDPCPVARAREALPDARIAMLADGFDPARLRVCFAAGADGFLLKNISSETLFGSLNLILLGEKVFPAPLADLLLREGNGTENESECECECENGHDRPSPVPANLDGGKVLTTLSEREIDILRCLVIGESNKHIAKRLNIAEATVKVHLKSILRKTRAMNRTQAAIWGLQRGVSGVAAAAILAAMSGGAMQIAEEAQLVLF